MKSAPLTLLVALAVMALCTHATAEQPYETVLAGSLPKDMRPLEAADISADDCEPPFKRGVVAADFNGDGMLDIAVLAVSRRPRGTVNWNGSVLQKVSFTLLVFMARRNGTFERLVLWKNRSGYLPSIYGIERAEPGEVHDLESEGTVHLTNPGIGWFACGKSSGIYFWKGRGFSEIFTSD